MGDEEASSSHFFKNFLTIVCAYGGGGGDCGYIGSVKRIFSLDVDVFRQINAFATCMETCPNKHGYVCM